MSTPGRFPNQPFGSEQAVSASSTPTCPLRSDTASTHHDYSVTHGVSQLDVCDAVWSLSSAICGSQPGNIMLEPNKSEGRQGRSTLIYPLEIDVNDPNQQRMYERSCALCPLEDSCELNFPSKRYYVQGKMIGTPRIRFPRTTLF